jgi:hypothetical protein
MPTVSSVTDRTRRALAIAGCGPVARGGESGGAAAPSIDDA